MYKVATLAMLAACVSANNNGQWNQGNNNGQWNQGNQDWRKDYKYLDRKYIKGLPSASVALYHNKQCSWYPDVNVQIAPGKCSPLYGTRKYITIDCPYGVDRLYNEDEDYAFRGYALDGAEDMTDDELASQLADAFGESDGVEITDVTDEGDAGDEAGVSWSNDGSWEYDEDSSSSSADDSSSSSDSKKGKKEGKHREEKSKKGKKESKGRKEHNKEHKEDKDSITIRICKDKHCEKKCKKLVIHPKKCVHLPHNEDFYGAYEWDHRYNNDAKEHNELFADKYRKPETFKSMVVTCPKRVRHDKKH